MQVEARIILLNRFNLLVYLISLIYLFNLFYCLVGTLTLLVDLTLIFFLNFQRLIDAGIFIVL